MKIMRISLNHAHESTDVCSAACDCVSSEWTITCDDTVQSAQHLEWKKCVSVVRATRNEMKTKSTFYLLDSRIVLHDMHSACMQRLSEQQKWWKCVPGIVVVCISAIWKGPNRSRTCCRATHSHHQTRPGPQLMLRHTPRNIRLIENNK